MVNNSNPMTETSFWIEKDGKLARASISPEPEIENSTNYPEVNIMHQGHTATIFTEELEYYDKFVDRPVEYIDHFDDEDNDFPLVARLKNWISGVTEEMPTKCIS